MEKEGGDGGKSWKGRNGDKAEQVLIGERLGGECRRYLLSQRGLRCEACLSRGPQRCEVITGNREEDRDILDRETPGEREMGTEEVNVAIKLAAGIMEQQIEMDKVRARMTQSSL